MRCQTEFHRQRAIILAGLDIGQQLAFPGFYLKMGSKGQFGAVTQSSAEGAMNKDFSHRLLFFLTIVLSSSGIRGGTGSPEILFTAPKRGGQASKQVPHFMHFS